MDRSWGFFCLGFLFCWGFGSYFFFFFFAMGDIGWDRSAFSQEKQHSTHYALRNASIVTLLRYFIHYLLEKWFTPGTYRHLWEAVDFWASAGTAGIDGYSSCRTWIMKLCIAQGKDQCHVNLTNLNSSHKENEGGRENCSDVVSQTCLNHSIISNHILHTMCYNIYRISKASIRIVILFWNVY